LTDSDFLKCNKEKFTTTQLVGGGIGVTLIIFGLAFAIIWFCRRRKALPKEEKKDVERSKKAGEAEDSDEEESSDEDERDHKRDQKSPSATSGAAARARAAQQASLDQRRSEAEKAPPRPPRTEQTLGHDLNPQSHSHPSSRGSSRAGSPTSSPHVRQLSLTNPDYRNSARASRAAPALSRPPSSISKPTQQPQRPQTAYQNQTRQPAVSSGLKPQDPRTVRASSYVPQAGERRPSQAQNPRAHSVHPPSGHPTRSSSRSSSVSMYSTTNRKQSYQDIPLPALPTEAHHKARSESVYSTASRRESPPGYTSASSRETSPKMKVQTPARPVGSHPGVSRQSTAASVQTFDDAREYLEEEKPQVPSRRAPKKPQAMAESPLPYERSP
jgi:hypothetical protein